MTSLKIQDYISIGIYTAIYFLVVCIATLVSKFIIPGYSSIFIPSLTALFAGVVYLLMIKRIPRFGAISIMGSVMGICFFITGHFPLSFMPNILCGILADIIQHRLPFYDKLKTQLSYVVFSLGLLGPVLPLWFMKQAYIRSLIARGKDATYIERVFAPVTTLSFIASVLATILLSMIGLAFGRKLYTKHFTQKKDVDYEKAFPDL